MTDTTKTWFITGASAGLGLEMTKILLKRGDRVAATARRTAPLNTLRSEYGSQLWIAALDVTNTAAIRATLQRAFIELGPVDVVASNAGYGLFAASEEVSDAQIHHQIDVNLIGSIQLIRAALPHLRAQGGGRILQVSSEGGQLAYPNFGLYHATKWGIEGFVEATAQEVAPFGIHFTIAEPGPTRTEFSAAKITAPAMPEYEHTPSGDIRRALESNTFPITGDAHKTAQAMIDALDQPTPPQRIALGSGTYTRLHAALSGRLATLEAQKTIALSVEAD